MAEVIVTGKAQAEIDGLPLPIFDRVQKLLARLRDWPNVSGAKRLTGDLAGKFRLRTGDYRVQFHVKTTRKEDAAGKGKKKVRLEHRISVEKVGHRDGFYA